ncbi:conserved hypothetical protein [Streptomyces pristinaespiralis ATCC 25486]|uniref:UspA domain-containing protein n=1 Tax=Streptomyces pristinaespiralis (strain ATCC 25486 / DSM 40338 / CBS 914.69 / JCM 4507 / KCC S-0507 / NBRC 13074 / NRRL 2958 / 5647) TaxID=457429 RepID=B5HHN4_STRE2|nr:conserved hypothetical protein [Streptomyces pristinaespiralis ATCC 25486]
MNVWSMLIQVGGVVTMLDGMDAVTQRHQNHLEILADRIRHEFRQLPVHIDLKTAESIAGTLVETSRTAGLLVLGKHHAATALGSHIGRVTHALLHHAHCPVLIAPRTR